ncbi:MAG: peptidoglycan D,D-transpeptidase FtsI family protein [Thermoanaerobacteraceae bacterium]
MKESNIRIMILKIVLSLFIIFLFTRLFYIQIIKGEEYSKKAVEQKLRSFAIGEKRGDIYDRNMIPITDRESKSYIYAIPEIIFDKSYAAQLIGNYTDIPYQKIYKDLNSSKKYLKYVIKKQDKNHLPGGVFILTMPERYTSKSLARHIVGYVGEKNMGLEEYFNSVLSNKQQENIAVFTNGNNDYMQGLGIRIVGNNQNPYSVKTTLDYHIQKAVENILDENHINGAAVVLDIKSGDILAMASRPNFDQNNIADYINSSNEEFVNKATSQYPPGSIFKIITASAAIENNKVKADDLFDCSGSYSINGVVFHDYKGESHGLVDIKKGFAVSCNTTFIRIGELTGGENILDMAKKFGLTTYDNNLPIQQQLGMLPKIEDTYGAGIGNLSIGQGDVMLSPLQAADIVATIANDGIRNVPNLIKGIVDERGNQIQNLYNKNSYRVISQNTSNIIKEMMREVVTEGTGKRAETKYKSAGKTGSAEVSKQQNIYHAWFVGFVPYQNPKYAISVFVKNGDTGGTIAAPIFKKIAEEIMKY